MTWLEWFGVLSGYLVASVLGAWLMYAAHWNGERTRALVCEMQPELVTILDRVGQRADNRHCIVIAQVCFEGEAA
ncbi:MAG TPA: hypothetical protein VIH59_12635 [Candidatus Tectomicrobia bacterium]